MTGRRRQATHVAVVIAVAAVARTLLFKSVGIWGDYGFYVYNSRLILEGQTPFVDFLGRSPLFIYALSGVRAVVGHPLFLPRTFIIALWLLTTIPIYLIARDIHSHRAGIAAALLFNLTPFGLVYGMWTNTQSLAALCATAAVYVVLRREQQWWDVIAGGLFAAAYLSRRSVFVIVGAVGLWVVYRAFRDRDPRHLVIRGSWLAGGFFLTLFGVYAAIVGFDPTLTWRFFEVHTLNLFASFGRGGYPLLTENAPIVTNEVDYGRVPIFNDVCQMCGEWTARTFAKTILVVAPTIGILVYYFRDLTDRYFTTALYQYTGGVLGLLALYAIAKAISFGFFHRTLSVVGLGLFVVVAYRSEAIGRDVLYDRRLQLVLLILAGLAAGYLYRNRVLHTYYFMDFWPYVSIASGVVIVEAWSQLDGRGRRLLIAALVISSLGATASAYPLTNVVVDGNAGGWFTYDNLEEYQQDIDARTEPDDVVLTTSPAYLTGSHARLPNNNARIHMVLVRYKDYGPALPIYADLNARMRSGSVEYIIFSRTMRQSFQWNETAERLFESNYCRVAEADQQFQRTNAYLFEYREDCPADLQPDVNMTVIRKEDPDDWGVRHDD